MESDIEVCTPPFGDLPERVTVILARPGMGRLKLVVFVPSFNGSKPFVVDDSHVISITPRRTRYIEGESGARIRCASEAVPAKVAAEVNRRKEIYLAPPPSLAYALGELRLKMKLDALRQKKSGAQHHYLA